MKASNVHQQAIDFLLNQEPRFAPVIERFGVYELLAEEQLSLFQAVSRTIIYQQLAGKAAASIYQKFKQLFEGELPTAEQTNSMTVETLRSAGLSQAKANSVKHLAESVLSHSLPNTASFWSLKDEEIVQYLLQVKGVGPWTANIVLMFWLGRPDVFPVNDLGLKKGAQRLFALNELPTEQQIYDMSTAWRPYRTYASWYLWRLLEI